jgi:hypothetical protein
MYIFTRNGPIYLSSKKYFFRKSRNKWTKQIFFGVFLPVGWRRIRGKGVVG